MKPLYYPVYQSPVIAHLDFNFDYYNPSETSMFLESTLELKMFERITNIANKYTSNSYIQFGANAKIGVTILLNTNYNTYSLLIPFMKLVLLWMELIQQLEQKSCITLIN